MSLQATISANIDAFQKNIDKAIASSKVFADKVNANLSKTDVGTDNLGKSAAKMGDSVSKSFAKAEGAIAMTAEEIERWDAAARAMSMQQYEVNVDDTKAEEAAAAVKDLREEQDQTGKSADNLSRNYDNLGDSLTKAGLAMSAVSAAIAGVAYKAISSFGDIQALQLGLTAVAGSAEAANAQFAKLTELAKLPGLGLPEVAKATINLQSIGLTAEFAERSIAAFGNAVATVGKGRVEFERAIYGLQQLANTDFPLGEDLNIIKDALPQVTKILDEAFGANRSDQLAKMGISSAKVVDAILSGLEKLPPVARGVNNAFESLFDSLTLAFSKIGDVINTRLNFEGVLNKLADGIEGVATWFENLDPIIQDIILVVGGLVAVIGPLMLAIGGIISIAPILGAAFTAMGGPITILVAAIGAAAIVIAKNWDRVSVAVRTFTASLLKNIGTVIGGMATLANAVGATNVYAVLSAAQMGVVKTSERLSKSINDERKAIFDASNAEYAAIGTKTALSGANDNLAKTFDKAAVAAKRLGLEIWKLRGIQALNDKELTGKGYKAPEQIGALDKGVTIDVGKVDIQGVLPQIQADAQELADSFNEKFSSILGTGIGDAIANMATSMGEALANGGNVIQAMGASLLGSLGSILTQLGKMAIGVGIGIESIKKALSSLNPGIAIAAGIALVALGSAFSAGAKSLGDSMGSASMGGYSNSAINIGNATPTPRMDRAPQRVEVFGEIVGDPNNLRIIFNGANEKAGRIR